MNRTALRLATIAALTNGGTAPFPTMAAEVVTDSRIDPVSGKDERDLVPLIGVFTDNDVEDRNAGGSRSLSVALKREVDLRVEFGISTFGEDADGNPWSAWPQTDAQLEATLDLFDTQIRAALLGKSPWALWWRSIFSVSEVLSIRIAVTPDQGSYRMAARELALRIKVPPDCLPGTVLAPDEVPAAALAGAIKDVIDYIVANGAGGIKAQAEITSNLFLGIGVPRASQWPRFEGGTVVTSRVNVPGGGEITAEFDLDS